MISLSNPSPTYGQAEVIKATVTTSPPNPSNTPNGGQVQFYETDSQGRQTLLGTQTLTESGTPRCRPPCSQPAPACSPRTIPERYLCGDDDFDSVAMEYRGSEGGPDGHGHPGKQAVRTPVPELAYHIAGLRNGDNASVVSGVPAFRPRLLLPAASARTQSRSGRARSQPATTPSHSRT